MNQNNVNITINQQAAPGQPVVSQPQPVTTTQRIKRPWQFLVDYVVHSTQYGDFLDHQSISAIMQVQYGLQEYSQNVSKANRELARYGKILKSIKSQGYEVLLPDGYTNHVSDMMASACRKMEYAKIVSINAPVAQMNPVQQAKHASMTSSVKTISSSLLQRVNHVRQKNGQLQIPAMK